MKFLALAAGAAAITKKPGHLSLVQMTGITDQGKWIPDRYATGEDD